MNNLNLAERVKELRNRKGMSQELLAEASVLSLRTIQRIENNETVPRGDTLKRLAVALGTSPDEIIDWKIEEDRNYLTLMSLSALSFLFFPILGIVIPMVLWIFKKDKIKHVSELGKAILNFQITWTLILFLLYILMITGMLGRFLVNIFGDISPMSIFKMFIVLAILYGYNIIITIVNAIRVHNNKSFKFVPAFKILK